MTNVVFYYPMLMSTKASYACIERVNFFKVNEGKRTPQPVKEEGHYSNSVRCDLPRDRSHARALLTLSCPFRGVRRSPARFRRPVDRHVEPCNLSWAFSALRHTLGAMKRDDRGSTRGPAGHVRRFGYLLRDLFIAPPGARSAGASMGLSLQGVLPVRGGAPSRGPCPPVVAGPRAAP
jgi:hypothetical protein